MARPNTARITTRTLVSIAMLTAISSVLMFMNFPIPIFPSFLKFDFSDLPAIIGAFAFGPFAGIVIELLKNTVHLMQTETGGIGELANFLMGTALVLPAGLIYRVKKTQKGALLGMLAGIISTSIVAALANYFILIPFYESFMPISAIVAACAKIIPAVDSLGKVIVYSIIPYNLFKGFVVCLITYLTYKRLSGLLHRS